ncbi:MAG TPA: hypothetical protein VKQ71_09335 [Acidimicrobiales bacterium]|nr:hypothetical protein [Acidimicrobiales bacterium]
MSEAVDWAAPGRSPVAAAVLLAPKMATAASATTLAASRRYDLFSSAASA